MQRTSNALAVAYDGCIADDAAMLMMMVCAVLRLLSPHSLVCRQGYTALMRAARKGHESIVRLLLEYLADVNARNR